MLKHVLVTLDGSELAEMALEYAREIIAPNGKITLLSVLDARETQMMTLYEAMPVLPTKEYEHYVEETRRYVREYLRRTAEQLHFDSGYEVEYEFTTGDPATDIVNRAKVAKVDAIVMSTHGRSGVSRWLFGSVTQKVLSTMPCPVFVVPGLQKKRTGEQPAAKATEPLKA